MGHVRGSSCWRTSQDFRWSCEWPSPLEELFQFTVEMFKKASGRRLFPIECHDLMCKIGEVVVVGGVRRSIISLSNLNDDQMRHAKSGQWWENEGQRALANNSVAYKGKPEMGTFMREWVSLYESKSGERGIFNRQAAQKQASLNGRRDAEQDFGCNPCSEIILRPYQFCNLSELLCVLLTRRERLTRFVWLPSLVRSSLP